MGKVIILEVYPHSNTLDNSIALFGKYNVAIIRRFIAEGVE